MGDLGNAWKQTGLGQVIQGIGNSVGLNANQTDVSGFAPSAAENQFTQMLMQRAQGQGGPSPAQLQMEEGLAQANAGANATAAASRGVSPALAYRLAQQQQGQNANLVNQQAGVLRAQEQLGSENTLANLYSSQRQSAGMADKLTSDSNQKSYDRLGGFLSQGGGYAAKALMSRGGKVPGKANVPGDSQANDKVPAMLSPGEIVVPRSKAQNAADAKEFIDGLMKGKGDKKPTPSAKSYGDVLKVHREAKAKLAELEKMLKSREG